MSEKLRVPVEELRNGELVLSQQASRYVTRVHRLGVGDQLLAFDPVQGVEADAVILGVHQHSTTIDVTSARTSLDTAMPVVLVQALAKSTKPEFVVREATALGARGIVLVVSGRTDYPHRRDKTERFKRVAVEAARQCGRGRLPDLLGPLPLAEYVAESRRAGIVLCPRASERIATVVERDTARPLHVFVGPEGGFTDDERATLIDSGAHPARLGPLTLRTETAAVAALGALRALLG